MKNVSALVVMLMASLLTSAAFGAPKEDPVYQASEPPNLVQPELGVVLKAQRDCERGTFFKNAFPSLTNGQDEGSKHETFQVGSDSIDMTVTWFADNSFEFNLRNESGVVTGVVHKAGVDIDSTDLLYNYAPPPVGPGPVGEDAGLNKLAPPATAAPDVNHLDLCLEPVDSEPPVVVIESPKDTNPPTLESGTVIVKATVTDNVGLSSVTASVYPAGGDPSSAESLGTQTSVVGDVYTWTWDEETDPPENRPLGPYALGFYTIIVTALDTAIPTPNEGSDSVTIELVNSAESCVGLAGDDDQFPNQDDPELKDPYAGGCKPTVVNVQLPPDNNFVEGPGGCDSLNGEKCQVTGTLLKPLESRVTALASGTCPACGVGVCPADTFPDPRMACYIGDRLCSSTEEFRDGRWVPNPDPANSGIRPLVVFNELGLSPDPDSPEFDADALVLNQYTFGNPCIVIANHQRNFPLKFAYPEWPNKGAEATGLIFIKTHFPEDVLPPEYVPKCYGLDTADQTLDLQEASQGGYQTTERSLMFQGTAAVWTDRCFNPPRNASRDKSFDISGIKETAGIDFDSPTGPQEVLDFKFEMAGLAFDALFAYIDDAANAVDEDGSSCLIRGKISDLTKFGNQARAQFNKRNVSALLRAIEDLTSLADVMRTRQDWCIIEDNPPGAVLAQDLNLIWRIEQIKDEIERLDAL